MVPAKWWALRNDNQEKFKVFYTDLQQNFSKEYLETIKQRGCTGNKGFIAIPPGDFKNHEEYPADLIRGPPNHYWQADNTRTCLTTSFANLL